MDKWCEWRSNLKRKYESSSDFYFIVECEKIRTTQGNSYTFYNFCPYCRKPILKMYSNLFKIKDPHADLIPIEDFIANISTGLFTDYDGMGYLATLEKESYIRVDFSGMDKLHSEEPWATHVAWYNK